MPRKNKSKVVETRVDRDLLFQPHQFAYEYFGRLPSTAQRLGEGAARPDEFHVAAVVAFRKSKGQIKELLLDNLEAEMVG